MITPNDLLEHMYKVLPLVTGRFFNKIVPTSARIDANLNLIITVPDVSFFSIGRHYNVQEVDLINPVVSCTGSIATGMLVETLNDHRITKPLRQGDPTTFKTEGTWVGNQVISDVPNRKTVLTRNGESTPLVGNVIERLINEDGYVLCTDIQGQEVTFELNHGYVYPCDCSVGFVLSRINLAVVRDIGRAKQVYTQHIKQTTDKLFAFLIMGDRNTIADKNADAGTLHPSQHGKTYLKVTTSFNILVFWPKSEDKKQEASRFDIQEAYGPIQDVFDNIFFGHRINRTDGWQTMPSGAGVADVADVANYAFVYEYQALDLIETGENGFKQEYLYYDVPTRDINKVDGEMYVSDGVSDPQQIFSSVNLDRVPNA